MVSKRKLQHQAETVLGNKVGTGAEKGWRSFMFQNSITSGM
jgi:hypothetical protein